MSDEAILRTARIERGSRTDGPHPGARGNLPAPLPFRFPARAPVDEAVCRNAELFYLQKQVQSQTPMMVVLEDGEQVEGYIEWWDRNSIKIRGRTRTLVYKSAVKYMYKLGEN